VPDRGRLHKVAAYIFHGDQLHAHFTFVDRGQAITVGSSFHIPQAGIGNIWTQPSAIATSSTGFKGKPRLAVISLVKQDALR